jgi:hypothetical protein
VGADYARGETLDVEAFARMGETLDRLSGPSG